jgi:hypothetical protein
VKLKKSPLFIKFTFIFLNNLKSVENKTIFYIKNFDFASYFPLSGRPHHSTFLAKHSVYLSWCVRKKAMSVVQTALGFVRGEAIPLDKVIAGFTRSLLQHQRQ